MFCNVLAKINQLFKSRKAAFENYESYVYISFERENCSLGKWWLHSGVEQSRDENTEGARMGMFQANTRLPWLQCCIMMPCWSIPSIPLPLGKVCNASCVSYFPLKFSSHPSAALRLRLLISLTGTHCVISEPSCIPHSVCFISTD